MIFDHKVALVTGSTSGIGLGIAQGLARAGCDVMLNGFGTADSIAQAQQAVRDLGGRVAHHAADMADAAQARGAVAATVQAFGRLDILVCNAGIQHTAPIEQFPTERWDAVIAINLSAAFHLMAAAIPVMKAAGWGRIVTIASAHGKVASANKSAYVAAKHGLIGLTKAAALELANSGVTANAICPGWVLTPLVERQLQDRAQQEGRSLDAAKAALLAEKQPLLEFSTPEQIGSLVAYLCSDQARTITGSALSVDGGWTAT